MAGSKGPRIRKTETSNKLEKARKSQKASSKKAKSKFGAPLSRIFSFLGKGLKWIVPGFLKGAFYEVRQVSWPNRRETIRLTWAVFVFAIVFSIIIAGLDFVLDKIFRSIILG